MGSCGVLVCLAASLSQCRSHVERALGLARCRVSSPGHASTSKPPGSAPSCPAPSESSLGKNLQEEQHLNNQNLFLGLGFFAAGPVN